MMKKRDAFRAALYATVPVLTGYLVLGFGFGLIMRQNGYGILWSSGMSLFVLAGAMQYAAVGLLTGGASLVTVALTTLAVNARHFFYGISMIDRYKNAGIRKPYLIFALTDETYSLVCHSDRGTEYAFFVSLLDHLYWVAGTVLGAVLGNRMPFNTAGIDFALTALFLTVFTDQWMKQKDRFPAILGVAASVVCLLIFGADHFLIPAMLVIAAALLITMKWGERRES